MDESKPTRHELSGDDQARMLRLTEEIQGRLQEISLIAGRVLGVSYPPDVVRQFKPVPVRRESDGVQTGIYIEIVAGGPGVWYDDVCFVYCAGEGTPVTWIESPCGGSMSC
ncbi:hypothetical protein [Hamadaea tsunoensis]|uniref:hypothetical protein n=1 Tax=Hamadaea tsunoensis TaxID=53368 RepID=UPI000411D270|nr:hypothetical protein [Hamadaea tsunoensis]